MGPTGGSHLSFFSFFLFLLLSPYPLLPFSFLLSFLLSLFLALLPGAARRTSAARRGAGGRAARARGVAACGWPERHGAGDGARRAAGLEKAGGDSASSAGSAWCWPMVAAGATACSWGRQLACREGEEEADGEGDGLAWPASDGAIEREGRLL